MGKIQHDQANVYRSADFDSQVITSLKAGGVYSISSKVVGAFYKIKVKDGVYGYIADTDVRSALTLAEKKQKAKEKAQQKEKEHEDKPKKRKALEWQRDRGLEFASINYREDTMGLRPTESILFYGAKFSGPDILLEGIDIDANVLISPKAPNYYEEATGNSASGFIMIMDLLLETQMPQGKDALVYYGFGPMLKYSKIDATLTEGGKNIDYALNDINVGAVFNLGYAHQFGSVVLRGEAQYYWEKMQYLGFALGVQLPF